MTAPEHDQWDHMEDPRRILGRVGRHHGIAPTEGEAWGAARAAAVKVMGRLEVPGGGEQLRRALAGEGT